MPNTRATVVSFSPTRSAYFPPSYGMNSGASPAFFPLPGSPSSSMEHDLESLVRSITSKPRSPSSSSLHSSENNPFWYGAEEPDQIKEIVAKYACFLKVDADRPANSRRPKCFVGSIRRTQQTSLDAPVTSPFCTVDEVCVYQLDIVPLDCPLSVLAIHHLAVTWDREDGLPVKLRNLDVHHEDDPDLPLAVCCDCPVYQDELDRCPNVSPSFLYCLPLYEHPSDEFLYLQDKRARPMSYFCDDVNKLCVLGSARTAMQSDPDEITPWSSSQPLVPSQPALVLESGSSVRSDAEPRQCGGNFREEKREPVQSPTVQHPRQLEQNVRREEQQQLPTEDEHDPKSEQQLSEDEADDDIDPDLMDDDHDGTQFIFDLDDEHVAFATVDPDELGDFVFQLEAPQLAPPSLRPRAREKTPPIAIRSNGRAQQRTAEPLSRSFEEVQAMLASLCPPRLVGF